MQSMSVQLCVEACVNMHLHVCMCMCHLSSCCVHTYKSENISEEFLLILHLVPKLDLFSLSLHMFSAILASQNNKMFKEKIC